MQKDSILPSRLEKSVQIKFFFLFAYIILPYVFFAIGVNVFSIPLAPGDGIIFGLPTKILMSRLELWNPYIQGGTFPFKDIGWQALYLPAILVMRAFPNPFGYNLLLFAHYSMAGFFTFLYLRKLNLKVMAAFIGGIAFMFCGFLSAHKGHHSMVMAASYLPVVLYFFESYLNTQKVSRLFLTALAFGLSILADYTAVPMYIGMVVLPYILFRVLAGEEYQGKSVFWKLITAVEVSAVIFGGGLMIAAVEILPILESLKYVTREKITYPFFVSYSFDYKLLPLLIFPYFFGTTSPGFFQPAYFGPWNLTEMAGYMGILPVISATLSFFFFRKRNSQIYFWTVIALIALVLVFGDFTPLYKLMYRIPVYNMFRASARNWLEVNFAVAVLSSFFIHYMISDPHISSQYYLSGVTRVVVLLSAAIILILRSAKNWSFPPEIKLLLQENLRIYSPAIYIPLIIVALSTVLLCLLYHRRERISIWIIVSIVLFLDLFSFGHFHDTDYRTFLKQPNEVADFLSTATQDKSQYRILTLGTGGDIERQLVPNLNLLYGFNVVNGYSPIWLNDYQVLTTFEENGVSPKKYELLLNQNILSLLSTKYLITSDDSVKNFFQTQFAKAQTQSSKMIPEDSNHKAENVYLLHPQDISAPYTPVYETSDHITIYENRNFLSRARFVRNLIVVNNSEAAIRILWKLKKFNPATTALVEDYSGPLKIENGEVINADYSNNSRITLSVNTGNKGYLVLSDSWYPGWKAYVDNQPTKIYRTNAVSRGVLIEGVGEHIVEFRFMPKSFYLGLAITGITMVVFVLYYFLIEKIFCIENRKEIKKYPQL